jgi:CRISPR-associated endonuclease/helicase Cas3
VSITKQRFASLISNDGIHRDVSAFQLLWKEEIKERSYYIIDRKYDDELGLQLDIEERARDNSNSL